MTQSEKINIIVIFSSGYHLYREYLLKEIAKSINVLLLCDSEPTWEKSYIHKYMVVNFSDIETIISTVDNLGKEDYNIQGVISWNEKLVVEAAQLAQALELPGSSPESINNCRDKHQTRTCLAKLNVPQPISILVSSVEEALNAVEQIGQFPVIVKPRNFGASMGVSQVNTQEELKVAFEYARDVTENGVPLLEIRVLIEELMIGEEVSVDAAWVNGEPYILYVAHKTTGYPPYFEEIAHVINSTDPLLDDQEFLNVLKQAHEAVGFSNGHTHTELSLTNQGPKVIEINARLGGDLIPYVGWIASGINPGQVAVQVALGQTPEVTAKDNSVAAIRFFYPDYDCVVENITINNQLPKSVFEVSLLAKKGQKLFLPPTTNVSCRYAYVIVKAKTVEECEAAIKDTAQVFILEATKLPIV